MQPGEAIDRPGPGRRGALRLIGLLPRRLTMSLIRMATPNYTVGALCLIECSDRLLVLGQLHRRGWTLPGGLLERHEDAAAAAHREVREETGLVVEVGEPLTVVVDPVERRVDVLFHVPVAEEPPVTPRSEAVRAAWLAPADLGRVDASTAQALAAFERSRRRGVRRGRVIG